MKSVAKITFSLIVLSSLIFTSCRKKELPAPKPNTGDVITTTVNMHSNYDRIIYFNLGNNKVVSETNKLTWDLAFSCNEGTQYGIMNGAKIMYAAKVTDKTFEQISNTSALTTGAKEQIASGRLDSMVMKDLGIYVIDRGYDYDGNQQGYFKVEVLENSATTFKGRFANIDGSNDQTITLQKNAEYNYVFVKWNTTGAVTNPIIEPKKDSWDIVFTQFSKVFYEPEFTPYVVVGCLTNPYKTLSCYAEGKTFDEINLTVAENTPLSTDWDAIGYDWKSFSLNQSMYDVYYNKVYLIKDQNDYYYKLRFVDFYSDSGEKGSPTFEYQRL